MANAIEEFKIEPKIESKTAQRFQVGSINMHLADEWKRRQILEVVTRRSQLQVCGVVESWLRRSNEVMEAELLGSDWIWVGKDRKGRRGGGIGILARKKLNPKLLASKNENILWVGVGSVYIAVVYLPPKDPEGVNVQTLDELEAGILQRNEIGTVIVVGDFNSRVGELANVITDPEESDLVTYRRESVDTKVNAAGRRLLSKMNACGMVLVNGVIGKADWTSFQTLGNAVIDFAWVHHSHLGEVEEQKTWQHGRLDGDHALIYITLRLPEGNVVDTHEEEQKPVEGSRKRWRTNGKNTQWGKLAACGDQVLGGWQPSEVKHADNARALERAEDIWQDWRSRITAAAEAGLGYKTCRKPKPQGWDGQLAKMLQERNRLRELRNRSTGEARQKANVAFREMQRQTKRRARQVRQADIRKKNELLLSNRTTNARAYWTMLKKVVGLGLKKPEIPKDALMEGMVVSGEQAKQVWQKAFQKLGDLDENNDEFDKEFLEEVKQEVKSNEQDPSSIANELDEPISYKEVADAIRAQKNGKAAGIDGLVSEIIKYGGESIERAVWRMCEEMFRLEHIPRDWARGIIFPLHKEGDPRVPDNYRGITLLSVVGKIYAMVLNNRVKRWCEERNVLVDEQAGFRMRRSTVDQTFILSELIRARRKKGLKTYCAFLDIRKAYDRIWRGLWKRLI